MRRLRAEARLQRLRLIYGQLSAQGQQELCEAARRLQAGQRPRRIWVDLTEESHRDEPA